MRVYEYNMFVCVAEHYTNTITIAYTICMGNNIVFKTRDRALNFCPTN